MFGSIAKGLVDAAVGALAGRVMGMVKVEAENAKQEMQEKATALAGGLIFVVVAAAFGFFALGVLLIAAVVGLAQVWPLWAAALAVGGALILIAGIFALVGSKKINKNKDLRPHRAIANIRGIIGR